MPKSSFKILIIEEKCKSCGLCVHYCKQGCLRISEKFNSCGYHPVVFIDTDYTVKVRGTHGALRADKSADYTEKKGCNGCGFCYLICPDVAIEVYK